MDNIGVYCIGYYLEYFLQISLHFCTLCFLG